MISPELRRSGAFGVATALLLLMAGAAIAYNPPVGPSDTKASLAEPRAHGTIILKAVELLQKDQKQMGDYFSGYRQQLLDGARRADRDGGDINLSFKMEILGEELLEFADSIPANTISHFYNPYTGEGLRLFRGAGAAEDALNTAEYAGIGPWELYTLVGPAPPATDVCDWFYAKAVDAMRSGNVPDAMMNLGKALHLLADMTVPQHVTDRHGGYPGAKHQEYETVCDQVLGSISHATSAADLGDMYTNAGARTPGGLCHEAAMRSTSLLGAATGNDAEMRSAASMMIPLAEEMSAALLRRFWEQWENENFAVVLVRVDRIQSMDGDHDNGSAGDFYAHVLVHDKWYPDTAALVNCNDVRPQVLSPFAWCYPRWISGRPDSIHSKIQIWDQDGGLAGADDRVDVCPIPGYALDFDYWLASKQVTGDIGGTGPDLYSQGGPSSGDNARMWLHVEHAPVKTTTVTIGASIAGTVKSPGGNPARGTYVFFRELDGQAPLWQSVKVQADGSYAIPWLKSASYVLRPAGSRYDFTDVPKTLKLLPGTNTVPFVAEPRAATPYTPVSATAKPEKMLITASPINAPGPLVNVLQAQMQAEAKRLMEENATFIQLPSSSFGVKGNGLGYPEKGNVLVHVASIVDPATGKPVLDPKSVKVVTKQIPVLPHGQKTITMLQGAMAGPGAASVKLRLSIWLGNQYVGYRKASEADNVTDSGGNAQFVLHAGTHAENVQVRVEVLENPVNPWCKPRATEDELLLFRPALQGDDKVAQVAYEAHPVKVGTLDRGGFARSLATMYAFDAQGAGKGDATATETLDGGRDLLRFQETVKRHVAVEELSAHPERLSRPIHRLTPGVIRPPGGRVH